MELYQYTVTERNSWENETFNYVFKATSEQSKEISRKCRLYGNGELDIQQTYKTVKQIKEINKLSSNSYMDFIWCYELDKNALENWTSRGTCFYKGIGLTKLEI